MPRRQLKLEGIPEDGFKSGKTIFTAEQAMDANGPQLDRRARARMSTRCV